MIFKLYFIDYAIIVVPIFPPLPLPSKPSPAATLIQANPTPLSMSMGHAYMFFGYSVPYAVFYIPMTILKLPIFTS